MTTTPQSISTGDELRLAAAKLRETADDGSRTDWDRAVALAVADCLDSEANLADTWFSVDPATMHTYSLAIARAVLGAAL